MSPRLRKLIGLFAIVGFLAGYVWLVTKIADHVPKFWLTQLVFYVVAGLSWGLPLLPLMRWMEQGRWRAPAKPH